MMGITSAATLGHFLSAAPAGVTIGDVTPLGAGLGMGMTLAGATAPATGGIGGASVLASLGASSSVGGLSVPASWSAATPAATGATLAGTGWTAAAEEGAGMSGVPGVMPGMASATGRGGYGFGAPRYGVKPTVMPKQVLV
jgi:PPE-repeat protein